LRGKDQRWIAYPGYQQPATRWLGSRWCDGGKDSLGDRSGTL